MMAVTATDENTAVLDARYGRTPQRKRNEHIILVVIGALITLTFVAWVFWAGFDNGQGNLDTEDVAFLVIDDSTVSVTWQVSVHDNTEVSCAIQAQNYEHAIVGWKIIHLPASTNFVNRYKETVRTSQRAVTGLIYRCWLT